MECEGYEGSSKRYFSIVAGKIRQKVDVSGWSEENIKKEKITRREYELKDGTKGVKFERVFIAVSGRVIGLAKRTTDYGTMLEVSFDDGVLSINTESRYFADFVKKFASCDPTKKIRISPYDFIPKGSEKKTVGLNVYQEGHGWEKDKAPDHFYDFEAKKYLGGFPAPEGDTDTFDNDDWKTYFIQVKKFLMAYALLNILPTIEASLPKEEEKSPSPAPVEMDDEPANPEDVPF